MRKYLFSLFGLLSILACSPSPAPIEYGQDLCDHCKMTVMDRQFGAELVTTKGKVYKFDAIECLADFYLHGSVPSSAVHSLWVTDFEHPGQFIAAKEATFLHSDQLRSPMSANLSAFASPERAEKTRQQYAGNLMNWEQTLQFVQQKWGGKPTGANGQTR